MAKGTETKIPLDAVPGRKKGPKKKYGPYPKKNGSDLAKVAELIVEVAKRL